MAEDGEELPKLVRDRIPEIIRENNEYPVTRIVYGEELEGYLREKIVEEAEEVQESGEIEEIADLLEVVDAYLEHQDIDEEEIYELREEKNMERGSFSEGIVLEDVEASENN
jgi:Uncharacterized conserved protein